MLTIRKIYDAAAFITFLGICLLLSLQYFEANPFSYQTTSNVLLTATVVLIVFFWVRTVALAKENTGKEWTTYHYKRPRVNFSHFTPGIVLIVLSNVMETRMTSLLWLLGMIICGGILINYVIEYFVNYPRFAISDKQLAVYGANESIIDIAEIKEMKQRGNYLEVKTKRETLSLHLKYMSAEEQEHLMERLKRSMISAIMERKERLGIDD
ncbi:MAG: hypothetical protein HRU41_03135 [Saprospiraceae bacterium]|nr:hypothetical protein [Saprospiraceae bacterium]